MSLKLRLSLFYGLLLAATLLVVAFAVYTLTERSLMRGLSERIEIALESLESSESVEQGLYASYATDIWNVLFGVPEALVGLPADTYVEIITYPLSHPKKGADLVNGFKHPKFTQIRPNPTTNDVYTYLSEEDFNKIYKGEEVTQSITMSDNTRLLVKARPASVENYFNPSDSTPAMVLVGAPTTNVEATLLQLRRNLLITVISVFFLFMLMTWFLASQALRPIQRMIRAADSISSRELSQRLPVPKARDEMRELAITINRMLSRLQESFDTQRRFTADASHELRTPVTAIGGHVNYLLRRTKPTEQQLESLTVIKSEAERMGKLVNDLLELARADAGFTVDKAPLNIVDVLEDVHREIAPVAGAAHIDVSVQYPLMEVEGDMSRLKQVVLNLIQNALNAGSTHITMSLQDEKEQLRLEILDNGSGIPEDAIPHLFERFYRVDGARSTRGNGSGLGLAIVKWIITQHNGKVSVESKVGEGTVFTVLLPKKDSSPAAHDMLPLVTPSTPQTSKSAAQI